MAPWDVTYTGLRARQPEYGHGGPIVVGVSRGGEQRNLELDDDRLIDAEWLSAHSASADSEARG
jgi:hypothetical protein